MTCAQDIIQKTQALLDRIEKIGVGIEGGTSAEHQTGGFGYTDEKIPKDNFYMPTDALTEDNCRRSGDECVANHEEARTTRQVFETGEPSMSMLGQQV